MRKMKKVMAAMLAATMTMSMGMTAFAEEQQYENMTEVQLKKTYKLTNVETTNPAETFGFGALTCTDVRNAGSDVTTATAPVPTINSVSYTTGEATTDGVEKTFTITLPTKEDGSSKYTSVGEYYYEFTETDNNTAGVTYRTTPIKLKVTVIEQGGQKRIAAIHTEGDNEAKSDSFDNVYSAGSLKVTKNVTGLLGDKQKIFEVKVKFTAPSGDTVNGDITYTDLNGEHTIAGDTDTKTEGIQGWTTQEVTIKVKDTTTVTFTNVPYGVSYEVVEKDYSSDGYDAPDYDAETVETAEIVNEDGSKTSVEINAKGVIDSSAESVSITNNKGGTVDTGISLDNVPYILLLAIAVLGMFGFVSKKRSSEF